MTPYTYKSLVQRIKRHIANGFPNSSFPISDNEILLLIEQSVATTIIGQTFNNAKIEGVLAVPEAYITTYSLPALQKDEVTMEWFTTLPQAPISLPLGHSLDYIYFADSVNGKSTNVSLIKQRRVSYRDNMPSPSKPRAWVEGTRLTVKSPDGLSLLGLNLYARMTTARVLSDNTDDMTIPPDSVESVWNMIIPKLERRMMMYPKDVVQDDLPATKMNIPQ